MMMVNPKIIWHWLLALWLVSVEFAVFITEITEWQHSSTLSYTLTEGKCSSTTISTLLTLYLTHRHWAYFYITVCRYMSNYRDVVALSISRYSSNKCLDTVQMTFLNYLGSGIRSVFLLSCRQAEWRGVGTTATTGPSMSIILCTVLTGSINRAQVTDTTCGEEDLSAKVWNWRCSSKF